MNGVCGAATGGKLVVVEDHWPEGGLGEAVVTALGGAGVATDVRHLAVLDLVPQAAVLAPHEAGAALVVPGLHHDARPVDRKGPDVRLGRGERPLRLHPLPVRGMAPLVAEKRHHEWTGSRGPSITGARSVLGVMSKYGPAT